MPEKQTIVDLEIRLWQTLVDKDAATATEMLADPCIVVGAQGAMAVARKDFAGMMADGAWRLHAFDMGRPVVTFPRPDMATIAYTVTGRMTVEGKPLILRAADASVWLQGGAQWRCVLHTETLLGDAFGRDRKAA